jgi:hypothetical protein
VTVRFATDENIGLKLVSGLRRRMPSIDILRIQDAGLAGSKDPRAGLLERARENHRPGRVAISSRHAASTPA